MDIKDIQIKILLENIAKLYGQLAELQSALIVYNQEKDNQEKEKIKKEMEEVEQGISERIKNNEN